ncbi:MAG: EAL domain-containing protein [Actinomycetota bacterium]|nr:EAL domain-containing protein [Actinomycetota bacterium]
MSKTYDHLSSNGWRCEKTKDPAIVVRIEEARLSDLFAALSEALTSREMDDTRALFKPYPDELAISDIPRARSLSQLSSLGRSSWLLDMLSEGRLTSFFQPIVRAAAPSEVFAQECLLRGIDREGNFVPPGRIFGAAKASDLLFQTDLAARLTAIRDALRHGVDSNLFVNFTSTSVYDPVFCLRSTVQAIERSGMPNGNVVFEVTETEEVADTEHLKNVVDYYREKGFKVALDDMGSGYSSLNLIHRLRPDFMKLDMQLIRGVDQDPYKAVVASKILEMAQGLGVETIVEGVETEEELAWARERGATFVQGFLIAKPASPPPTDLAVPSLR